MLRSIAAEDDAVERRRPTTSRAWPSSPRGWKSARCRRRVPAVALVGPRRARARPARAAASRRAAAAAGRARAPRPARSRAASPTSSRSRVAPAAAQPDPADEPVEPAADPPGEREGVPAVLAADALDRPATAPRARRRPVGVALVDVEAAAGPVGVGGQRVARRAGHGRPTTSGWRRRRRGSAAAPARRPRSKPISPSGGSGTYVGDVVLGGRRPRCAATRPAAGRCAAGTGVTSPTQWLDSRGVSTGTGTMSRRGSPATAA